MRTRVSFKACIEIFSVDTFLRQVLLKVEQLCHQGGKLKGSPAAVRINVFVSG